MSELDDALERFHLSGFETADAQPNCGPMAVEALESLGHSALIPGLVDVYAPRLPVLAEGRPMEDAERAGARGSFERAADWLASYEQALSRSAWPEVLREAVAGVVEASEATAPRALALNGLIRLEHAVRSLSREDNPARRRELAFALAYWTAGSGPTEPPDGGADWLSLVGPIPERAEAWSPWLSTLCRCGAERYLAASEQRVTHAVGVMAPSGIRFLLPFLPGPLSRTLLQCLVSSLASSLPAKLRDRTSAEIADREVERCAENPSEIRYRAACSLQEHAIMMAEACLREDALASDAIFRRAAADAALRLSPPGYKEWRGSRGGDGGLGEREVRFEIDAMNHRGSLETL